MDCQSDIVVGMNYNKEIIEDERELNSDFHDLLFIEDLFKDYNRFNELLENLRDRDVVYEHTSDNVNSE